MIVKELIKLLKKLDPDAVIDMASDEEGNNFGDISSDFAEGYLKDKDTNNKGNRVYSLYPESCEMPEERFWREDE